MNMKNIAALLLTVLLMVGMSFMNGSRNLAGTWEGELTLSLLGEAVEEPGEVVGTIRITFDNEGNGTVETFTKGPLEELPAPGLMEFHYTKEKDQLTFLFENGQERTVTVWKSGDNLSLEGKTTLDMTRV